MWHRPKPSKLARRPLRSSEIAQTVELWCIAALLCACRDLSSNAERTRDEIASAMTDLGLLSVEDDEIFTPKPDMATLRRTLRDRAIFVRRTRREIADPTLDNVARLSGMLGLDEQERALLGLLVLCKASRAVERCMTLAAHAAADSREQMMQMLADILDIDARTLNRVASPRGLMTRAGLLKHEWDNISHGWLGLSVESDLASVLSEPDADEESLLTLLAPRAPQTQLGPNDYAYMNEDLDLLVDLVRNALLQRQQGVNVLLHGPPGTGKTELARLVAARAHAELRMVPTRDAYSSLSANRMKAYATAQHLLSKSAQTVLLFDEVEDAFPYDASSLFGVRVRSTHDKAWVNGLLESNAVPAVWISNHIEHLDPALLRRFTVELEVRPFPLATREAMARRVARSAHVPAQLEREWIERVAANERVTPAALARFEHAATLAGLPDAATSDARVKRLTQMCGLNLGATARAPQQAEVFDTQLARTNVELDAVVDGLRRRGRGSVLMYGAPGTGKTAFAYHVGRTLDRPVHHIRASSLLDPYVGATEHKMAEMFERARAEGAVLLLDEADTFFASRHDAKQRWEVSQTNELLMQSEAADCIFMCTTNLVDRIDAAAFRRFDLRIRFEQADPLAVTRLVARTLERLGAAPLSLDTLGARLGDLRGVSAGDVAAVTRQFELLGSAPTPEALAEALREDARLRGVRGGAGRTDGRIGF